MLPQSKRIPRALFSPILVSRRYYNSKHFSLRVGLSEDAARVAVSVSKKISKKAVVRNRIRRRVYAVFAELLPILPNNLYLLIAKNGAEKIRGEGLRNELFELIRLIRN